jgi:hypothetical protein
MQKKVSHDFRYDLQIYKYYKYWTFMAVPSWQRMSFHSLIIFSCFITCLRMDSVIHIVSNSLHGGESLHVKLIVAHLLKKFPGLNGTWRFITLFTRALGWFPFGARLIQSTPPQGTVLILSPFYACVFIVGSCLEGLLQKLCMHFSLTLLHALPVIYLDLLISVKFSD